MVYSSNVSELQTSNNQSLSDIQNLQQIELNLFTSLEQGIANGTLTPAQQTQMVNKINEISQMRINLYSNMSNMSGFYADNLSASVNILGQQKQTITIVEKELNEAKQRLKAVQQQKNNNLRLVEINTYYGQRYNDHASMMKWIILVCVPVILLAFLNKRGILPTNIYSALLVVILVVSLIFLWWKFIYLISHDNMNYQEYTAVYIPPHDPLPGQACCSTGTTYSSSANQCLPSSSPASSS